VGGVTCWAGKLPLAGVPTGFHPSWSSLCHLGICSSTNLRLRRLVPIFYGIFKLAGAQTQETEKLVIFWLQKKLLLSYFAMN
jgi:hypothetical protein